MKDRGSELSEKARLILAVVCLVVLFAMALAEPLLPDAQDCEARGRAADCWKDAR